MKEIEMSDDPVFSEDEREYQLTRKIRSQEKKLTEQEKKLTETETELNSKNQELAKEKEEKQKEEKEKEEWHKKEEETSAKLKTALQDVELSKREKEDLQKRLMDRTQDNLIQTSLDSIPFVKHTNYITKASNRIYATSNNTYSIMTIGDTYTTV